MDAHLIDPLIPRALAALGDAVFVLDPAGCLLFMNNRAQELLGWRFSELQGKDLHHYIHHHAEDGKPQPVETCAIRQSAATGKVIRTAGDTFIRRDGSVLHVSHVAVPLVEDGNVVAVVVSFHDIRERRAEALKLRETESQFRVLAESTHTAIFIWQGTHIVYANQAAELITGYRRDELLRLPFWQIVHPDHRALVRQRGIAHQRGENVPDRYEFKLLTKAGQVRWVDFSSALIPYEGRPAAMGTLLDISERKRAEEELQRFKSTLDLALGCVYMFESGDFSFIYANQGALEQLGYSADELMQMTPLDIIPGLDQEAFHTLVEPLLAGSQDRVRFETLHRHKGGRDIPVDVLLQYVAPPGGQGRFVAIARDISEEKHELAVDALMYEVDQQVLQGHSLDMILRFVCERVRSVFKHPLVWVGLKQPDGTIAIVHRAGPEAAYLNDMVLRWDDAPEKLGPAGRAIRAGRTQTSSASGEWEPERRQRAGRHGLRGCVALPLELDGEVIGVLGLYSRYPGDFDAHVLARLEQLDAAISRGLQRAKEHERMRLQGAALTAAVNAVFITDRQGVITWANAAFTRLSGYALDEALGSTPRILKSGKQDGVFYRGLWQTLLNGEPWRGEVIEKRKDGSLYTVEQTITPIRDARGEISHFVAIHEDVTERKEAEERIRYMAHHDHLTGLPNRVLFRERLETALAHAARNECLLAVLFLDLNNFKDVNDTLGHTVGDLLLRGVAERLRRTLRQTDTVARLGGDEFAIIQSELTHVDGAATLAEKIIGTLSQPFVVEGHEILTGTSIGITIYPFDDGDLDRLLKDADMAMYRAKSEGRHSYHFYDVELDRQIQERITLERSLHQALRRNELELYYQPQMDLSSGRIVGMEALLRWRHPELGYVSPTRFIPIAESSGLIGPIGEWVLHTACQQARQWQDMGLPPLRVGVNLSAAQFKDQELVVMVRRVLEDTGLPSVCLELEMTESMLARNAEATIKTLNALHDLGVALAIDDFGTGYSSLNYLRRFPVHKIKIDKGFTDGIRDPVEGGAIIDAIVHLGRSLGLKVIAEGVETEQQMDYLRRHGCHEMQGYLLSPPLPAQAFEAFMRGDLPRPSLPEVG